MQSPQPDEHGDKMYPNQYLKLESPDPKEQADPQLRGPVSSARAFASTVPRDSAKSNVGTSQPETRNQVGSLDPTAAPTLDNALSINSAGPGQFEDAPRPSGNALGHVHAEVHHLRQTLGTMLQRVTTLEFTLQRMGQKQSEGSQLECADLNSQRAQHTADPIKGPHSTEMRHRQAGTPAFGHSNSSGPPPQGINNPSMQSMLEDQVARQKLRSRSQLNERPNFDQNGVLESSAQQTLGTEEVKAGAAAAQALAAEAAAEVPEAQQAEDGLTKAGPCLC